MTDAQFAVKKVRDMKEKAGRGVDWRVMAAMAIVYDLRSRAGIGDELNGTDEATMDEITKVMADIISLCEGG